MDINILQDILSQHDYSFVKKLGQGANGIALLVQKNTELFVAKATKQEQKWNHEKNVLLKISDVCKSPKKYVHVPCIMDYFQINEWNIIVTDWIPMSITLQEYIYNSIKDDKEISKRNLEVLIENLTHQLHHLHVTHNITHDDIKPENIILSVDNNDNILLASLIDYGEACISTECLFGGTPKYWSPEHFKLPKFLQNVQTLKGYDIWALGVTLYITANYGYFPYPDKSYMITDPKAPDATKDVIEESLSDSFGFGSMIFGEDSRDEVNPDLLAKALEKHKINDIYKANSFEMDQVTLFFVEGNDAKKSMSGYYDIDTLIDNILITDPIYRPRIQDIVEMVKSMGLP